MAFRGYFALNTAEFVNSSRTVTHLGLSTPTNDLAFGGFNEALTDCSLTEASPGLFVIPADTDEVSPGLYRPPNGARRFGPGLYEVGDCWGSPSICADCAPLVQYDDSWEGLANLLNDGDYRPELAPWYVSEIAESAEFAGVWVTEVTGLDVTPVDRTITPTVGPGAVASPNRDAERVISFTALLVACTNAGVQYGLNWLTCQLRETTDNVSTRLRYLKSHPGYSSANPEMLLREVNSVVLTKAPEIQETILTGPGQNRQANIYRVTWELTALNPYAYLPAVELAVTWDQITRQPINWIHAADCSKPETCLDMPVLFSADCVPEEIPNIQTPPPVCGGCMPVSAVDKYSYRVPTMDYPFECRETAVSLVIRNTGESPLTLQAFWRVCSADVRCEDNQWPLQVAGLPPAAELHLDGITGRYWAVYDELKRRPVGVVGTPTGAPWRPPVIDRQTCWDFIVHTSSVSEFEVSMVLTDREP